MIFVGFIPTGQSGFQQATSQPAHRMIIKVPCCGLRACRTDLLRQQAEGWAARGLRTCPYHAAADWCGRWCCCDDPLPASRSAQATAARRSRRTTTRTAACRTTASRSTSTSTRCWRETWRTACRWGRGARVLAVCVLGVWRTETSTSNSTRCLRETWRTACRWGQGACVLVVITWMVGWRARTGLLMEGVLPAGVDGGGLHVHQPT